MNKINVPLTLLVLSITVQHFIYFFFFPDWPTYTSTHGKIELIYLIQLAKLVIAFHDL